MGKSTNKNRMLHSRIVVSVAFLLAVITKQFSSHEAYVHELTEFAGYILIVLCGLGRLYTTAFLGGHKNRNLITYGPFSVVRNPLYVFSWLGFTGIALFSVNLWVILIVPAAFLAIYHQLVLREEVLLLEKFGPEYASYLKKVPRFIPKTLKQTMPEEIPAVPHYLMNGLKDASVWFIAPPVFELLETVLF